MSFESDVLNRLDRVTALLLAVQPNALPTTPAVPGKVPAYDRPQLPVEQVRYFDGKTFNSDGSLWTMQDEGLIFSPGGGGAPTGKKVPVCVAYGYISPVKTPEIWRVGAKWSSNWEAVDAEWRRNPYRIYRADIPAWIKEHGEDVNNFIMLGWLLNAMTSFVQE